MAKQAQDTFVAQLRDGTIRRVTKGEVLPDRHELVKRDAEGSGTLFRDLDLGEDEAPAKSRSPRAAKTEKADVSAGDAPEVPAMTGGDS